MDRQTKLIDDLYSLIDKEEENKMVKIDKSMYAFSDTLKADDIKKDEKVVINEVKPVSTQFGEKFIAVLDNDKQVFLNALSLQNLAEGIADDTDKWVGEQAILTTETSKRTQNRKSIVLLANEEQRVK